MAPKGTSSVQSAPKSLDVDETLSAVLERSVWESAAACELELEKVERRADRRGRSDRDVDVPGDDKTAFGPGFSSWSPLARRAARWYRHRVAVTGA